jgi:hypothetical protein
VVRTRAFTIHRTGRKIINRRGILSIFAMTMLGLALLPSSIVAQQGTLKQQLVGTWTLVSCDAKQPFCVNPSGSLSLDASGRYTQVRFRVVNFCVSQPVLPLCLPCRTSRGRKPIRRARSRYRVGRGAESTARSGAVMRPRPRWGGIAYWRDLRLRPGRRGWRVIYGDGATRSASGQLDAKERRVLLGGATVTLRR